MDLKVFKLVEGISEGRGNSVDIEIEDRFGHARCQRRGGWVRADSVFYTEGWSSEGGGYSSGNSWCLLASDRGQFVYRGQRVRLINLGGAKCVRWDVSINDVDPNEWEPLERQEDHLAFCAFAAEGLEVYEG